MNLEIRVVSQQPPGGRCTLYAGYAEVLAAPLLTADRNLYADEVGAGPDQVGRLARGIEGARLQEGGADPRPMTLAEEVEIYLPVTWTGAAAR